MISNFAIEVSSNEPKTWVTTAPKLNAKKGLDFFLQNYTAGESSDFFSVCHPSNQAPTVGQFVTIRHDVYHFGGCTSWQPCLRRTESQSASNNAGTKTLYILCACFISHITVVPAWVFCTYLQRIWQNLQTVVQQALGLRLRFCKVNRGCCGNAILHGASGFLKMTMSPPLNARIYFEKRAKRMYIYSVRLEPSQAETVRARHEPGFSRLDRASKFSHELIMTVSRFYDMVQVAKRWITYCSKHVQ